jgi:pimeloyl-ACP methyl ester carboxylesterase
MIATVDGIDLAYEQAGTGPDVVLIPGLGGSRHFWYAQLRALSPVARVTAVDPRGHGDSARPPGPYRMRLWADDTAGLMRHLGIGPAVVVGSSMSAMVGVEMAAAFPDAVSGLVLVGGFPKLGPAGRERMEARAATAEREGMAALVDMVASTALAAVTHQTQPALVGLFRAALLRNDPNCYAAAARAITEADVTLLLPQVRCPTLVLLGDGEQVAALPAAQALHQGITGSRLQVIPNAGHLPFLEQPAAFNSALLQFLGSL